MIKDLGNGKKSKAIAYTSQLFTTTVPIPSLSNQSLITLDSSKEILKGTLLSLKEKPYEYDFKNMDIKLFAKDKDGSKQKIIEYTSYVIIAILVIKGIIMYVFTKTYNGKNSNNKKNEQKQINENDLNKNININDDDKDKKDNKESKKGKKKVDNSKELKSRDKEKTKNK
ncbi:MAG: hypothetical protein HXK70_02005 [Clostridiales bacterium]|nr:hypothetical protein [Clostridiales bacterium]